MSITYPNPLPFKLRVLHALTDALKEITPANGYVNDMADFDPGDGVAMSRVYRGRAWFGDSDPIPMLSVLEGVSPADEVAEPPQSVATSGYDWLLLVQGFVNDDALNPTDPAYLLEADVHRRLAIETRRRHPTERYPDPLGMGGGANRVEGLKVGFGVNRPADDTSAKAYFWLTLTLRVVANADPYAI